MSLNKSRILVIEADETLRSSIVKALETEGVKVMVAPNLAQGLKKAYEDGTQAVVLDIDLPGVNAEEALFRLLQVSSTPLLVLGSDKGISAQLLIDGADAYLHKPANLAELVVRLRGLLRRIPPDYSAVGEPDLTKPRTEPS